VGPEAPRPDHEVSPAARGAGLAPGGDRRSPEAGLRRADRPLVPPRAPKHGPRRPARYPDPPAGLLPGAGRAAAARRAPAQRAGVARRALEPPRPGALASDVRGPAARGR